MKILTVKGGLGNQMFAYANYLALRKRFWYETVLLEMTEIWDEHNSRDIMKVFPTLGWHSFKYYRRVQKSYSEYKSKALFKIISEKEENYGTFVPDFFDGCSPFCVYEGYWQSEKYFSKVTEQVRKCFAFDEGRTNEKTRHLADYLKNDPNSVSIHIRRGDYLKYPHLFGGTCPAEYYAAAIAKMEESVPHAHYFFFSDDIEWVKDSISNKDTDYFVDWNKGEECWQDMYLMSQCRNNIIANSTFSWWGAWLNPNPSKVIIAPKKWFTDILASDIIPQEWIKL